MGRPGRGSERLRLGELVAEAAFCALQRGVKTRAPDGLQEIIDCMDFKRALGDAVARFSDLDLRSAEAELPDPRNSRPGWPTVRSAAARPGVRRRLRGDRQCHV